MLAYYPHDVLEGFQLEQQATLPARAPRPDALEGARARVDVEAARRRSRGARPRRRAREAAAAALPRAPVDDPPHRRAAARRSSKRSAIITSSSGRAMARTRISSAGPRKKRSTRSAPTARSTSSRIRRATATRTARSKVDRRRARRRGLHVAPQGRSRGVLPRARRVEGQVLDVVVRRSPKRALHPPAVRHAASHARADLQDAR